jgi:hypothetical protein
MNMRYDETVRRGTRSLLAWILFAVCASMPLAAQTPEIGASSSTDAARKEMQELFKKVELRLREIDRLLTDASAGDREALKANADSGMDKLLEGSQQRGREVLQGIDRILELARQLGDQKPGEGGGGSGEPQPGDGKSQLDRRGEQSTEREQTPAKPEQEQSSPSPEPGEKPGGEKPQGEKPGEKPESGTTPKDNKGSKDDPKNTPGPKPASGATEGPNRNAEGQERWGELPVHVRDVFRIEGGGDMPVQYRDWIDSYYRRLNKKP